MDLGSLSPAKDRNCIIFSFCFRKDLPWKDVSLDDVGALFPSAVGRDAASSTSAVCISPKITLEGELASFPWSSMFLGTGEALGAKGSRSHRGSPWDTQRMELPWSGAATRLALPAASQEIHSLLLGENRAAAAHPLLSCSHPCPTGLQGLPCFSQSLVLAEGSTWVQGSSRSWVLPLLPQHQPKRKRKPEHPHREPGKAQLNELHD